MLYAVQYRNPHTAVHHYALFNSRSLAIAAFEAWEKYESRPSGFAAHCLEDFEIHWAYPPSVHPVTGEPVRVVGIVKFPLSNPAAHAA